MNSVHIHAQLHIWGGVLAAKVVKIIKLSDKKSLFLQSCNLLSGNTHCTCIPIPHAHPNTKTGHPTPTRARKKARLPCATMYHARQSCPRPETNETRPNQRILSSERTKISSRKIARIAIHSRKSATNGNRMG